MQSVAGLMHHSIAAGRRHAMLAGAIDLSYGAGMDGMPELRPADAEAAIARLEQALSITITVRDLTGWLRGPDGENLLPPIRNSHRRLEVCRLGFAAACISHCRTACHEALRTHSAPQMTRCWKGVREVLIPVVRNGILHGYLFAGAWRANSTPDGPWRRAWRRLPVWSDSEASEIAAAVALLADGLWHMATSRRGKPTGMDRAGTIRAFFEAEPARGRAALARHLGLSLSRTSHLVRSLCGRSLQEVITDARLAAAKRLLADSDLAVADVGARIGWSDAPHFARIFAARVGLPPSRWRAAHRSV